RGRCSVGERRTPPDGQCGEQRNTHSAPLSNRPLVTWQGVEPGAREADPRRLWILLQECVPRSTFSLCVRYYLDGRPYKDCAEVADASRSHSYGEFRAVWEPERVVCAD